MQEGQEPLVFRARFDAWDDGAAGVSKVFQDVYDKRVEQMSVSGGRWVVVVEAARVAAGGRGGWGYRGSRS